MDLSQLYAVLLAILGPIAVGVVVWIAGQAASVAKQKWGVDIDVSELQRMLANRKIEQINADTLHSGIKTGVAKVISELEKAVTPTGQIVVTPSIHEGVVGHLRASLPGVLASLSPAPDVIDNLIIRYAQDELQKRLGWE